MQVIKHNEDVYLFKDNGEVYKFDFANNAWKPVANA